MYKLTIRDKDYKEVKTISFNDKLGLAHYIHTNPIEKYLSYTIERVS